jgi:hypothetical protein
VNAFAVYRASLLLLLLLGISQAVEMETICSDLFDFDEICQLYKDFAVSNFPQLPPNLKRLQGEAVHAILTKKDLICILPTGYGKTLCILLPIIIISKVQILFLITCMTMVCINLYCLLEISPPIVDFDYLSITFTY